MARFKANELLTREFSALIDSESSEIKPITRRLFRRWVNQIKVVVAETDSSYVGISSLVLNRIRRFLSNILANHKPTDDTQAKRLAQLIEVAVRFVFFVYAMDTRVRTTYVVSQILIILARKAAQWNGPISRNTPKLLLDSAIPILRSPESGLKAFSSEKQNLLIALSDLGEKYLVPESLLAEIAGFSRTGSTNAFLAPQDFDYFQIVSLLFSLKDYDEYQSLRAGLENRIVSVLEESEDIALRSEHAMLLLDSLTCPYISRSSKTSIARLGVIAAGGGSANQNGINSQFSDACQGVSWFTSWTDIDIGHLLMKKELKTPYA